MIEIPTWLLFVLVAAIVILFVFNQELNRRILRIQFDQIQLGVILNKSFSDITSDMDSINRGLDEIDLKYEKIEKELSKREKEYQTKMLIDQTKKDLEQNIEKLKHQKNNFLEIAKKARAINDKSGLQQAYAGWKVSNSSQKRANMMLIKLNITEQMKDIGEISKNFSLSMLEIAKQLNDITKQKNYSETQLNYEKAMEQISESEATMEQFFETMDDSFETNSFFGEETENSLEEEFLGMVDEAIAQKEIDELEKTQSKLAKNTNSNSITDEKLQNIKKKIEDGEK